MNSTSKPTIFSGIQPSGNLHLGNYLGAIKQWVEMQNDYYCIFCVVDYHAITVPQDPKMLREKIIEVAKIYLASGIDPEKSIIFQQSAIKEHTELAWILNCTSARMSDLENMTQYKDKSGIKYNYKDFDEKESDEMERQLLELISKLSNESILGKRLEIEDDIKNRYKKILKPADFIDFIEKSETLRKTNVSVGLFDYPVLMAADILLYDTDLVPVGDDQVQHVELTRDLAQRFNNQFGETFKVPEYKIRKEGARIMGLDDPTKKMSKSATSEYNYIALTDDPEKAAKKIMKAATDSEGIVKYDKENKPGISNLLVIYSLLAEKPIAEIEAEFAGKQYGEFKGKLAEIVKDFLTKFQERWYNIKDKEVCEILEKGARALQNQATTKINEVKTKLGTF